MGFGCGLGIANEKQKRELCALDVIASLYQLINRRPGCFGVFEKVIDGSDISNLDRDAAREDEDEGNNADEADGIKGN